MWLINDDGFFSTVQDYKDSDWVYVRGRSETDIEAFVIVARRATSQDAWDAEIVHTPDRDYSWRVHTPPGRFGRTISSPKHLILDTGTSRAIALIGGSPMVAISPWSGWRSFMTRGC